LGLGQPERAEVRLAEALRLKDANDLLDQLGADHEVPRQAVATSISSST
jgi:hypothetical protein